MKAKHLILLLLPIIMCTSCLLGIQVEPGYRHRLYLYFQDASGNNLLKGIDPERWDDLHTLSLIFSEPCMNMRGLPISDIMDSGNSKGDYYIDFQLRSDDGSDCPNPARMVILQLWCPRIFGDNATHEIETYWIQKHPWYSNQSKCYRIVIGDKEITDITYKEGYESIAVATITLEK